MHTEAVRILILEDDEDLRFVLSQVLEAEGYDVETAGRGQEAVDKAAARPFDVVVADIRMDGLDGLEALAHVKEQQPGVRALVVTGYSTEADSIRAIRLGVGDYLKKPFDLNDFLVAVSRLVAERRQEQSRKAREQALLGTLKSALEALARSLDAFAPTKGFVATGQRAARLARHLNLSAEASQEVELATLVAATSAAGVQPFDESQMPPGLVRVIRHLDENWDGSGGPDGLAGAAIPLESRVAAVALAAGRSEPMTPGRFDPSVVAALDAENQPAEGRPKAAQLRGLLSLGRALEASGDFSGAEQAYHHASDWSVGESPDRETVEALFGLSRLARRRGQMAEATAHARRATEVAQRIGPGLTALAFLEAGVVVAREEAADFFRQAGRLFQALRVPSGEARALLALHILGGCEVASAQLEGALALLLQPEYAGDLAASANWLLPFVLRSTGLAIVDRAAARMVREFQRELCRQLTAGELDVAARVAAATALGGTEGPAAQLLAVDSDPAVRAVLQPAGKPAAAMPLLRIHSFGPLEVFRGEQRVDESSWRGQKNKFLFAFLASQGGKATTEDVLVDTFWPDDAEKGRRSLYWASSVLRRCLRQDGPEGLDYVPRSGAGLQLNSELPRWHDFEELHSRVAEAARHESAGRHDQALDAHRRVVALYRGPYLEGCYMDWAAPLRTLSEDQVGRSLSILMEAAQRAGRHPEALEHSQRLLELDPCRQEAAILAMTALLALGRPEEAVRRFEACRKALHRDLDLEPGIPLLEAYHRARLCL